MQGCHRLLPFPPTYCEVGSELPVTGLGWGASFGTWSPRTPPPGSSLSAERLGLEPEGCGAVGPPRGPGEELTLMCSGSRVGLPG